MIKDIKILFKANKTYLSNMFKNGKIYIICQIALIGVGVPLNLLQLYAPKYFIEEITSNISPFKAFRWIVLLVVVQLLFLIFSNVINVIRQYYCTNAKLLVKEETYKHFLSLYLSYFDDSSKLDNIQRALAYGESGGTSFFMFIVSIVTSCTSFATITYVSLNYQWWIWAILLFSFSLKAYIGNITKK